MLCPHCNTSLKYKERSSNTCSSCYKKFAFEPKTHPLRISDNYFNSAVSKLSNSGKLYFTPQQLQFAVSRKKMKSGGLITFLTIFAFISTIVGCLILFNMVAQALPKSPTETIVMICFALGISIILFWIILILAVKKFHKPIVSLPQGVNEFENSVLDDWQRTYQKHPPKLALNFVPQNNQREVKGILFCESSDAAMCLSANQTDVNLGLKIATQSKNIIESLGKYGRLPIFVLHDASIAGIESLEKVRSQFGKQTPVIDIGLRPQSAMKTNLPKMRENRLNANNLQKLTSEEIAWLNQGYYIPLYVLRPEKLIQYVTKQLQNKSKLIKADDSQERAKALGFMTWAS